MHMPTDEVSPSDGGGGRRWAPHGQALTACLVALNVLVVLLIYYYFWRFFSGKGETAADDDDDDAGSSAASSPAASPKAQNRREVERAITALPVFVHSSSSSGGLKDSDGDGKAAVECAICIAEFGDGEEGRLLPRCGHRFHARCVDMWFHFHTTCPLCRASVLPAAAAEPEGQPSETNYTDTDCPV